MDIVIVSILTTILTSYVIINFHMTQIINKYKEMKKKEDLQFQQHLKRVEDIVVEIVSRKL